MASVNRVVIMIGRMSLFFGSQFACEYLPELLYFRLNNVLAIGNVAIAVIVILVVVFCFIKNGKRDHLGHHGFGIGLFFVDLFDVVFGLSLLDLIVIKDGGTILGAYVVALPVQLGRVMHHEEDLQ